MEENRVKLMSIDELRQYISSQFKDAHITKASLPVLMVYRDYNKASLSDFYNYQYQYEWTILKIYFNEKGELQEFYYPLYFPREIIGFISPYEHTPIEVETALRTILYPGLGF